MLTFNQRLPFAPLLRACFHMSWRMASEACPWHVEESLGAEALKRPPRTRSAPTRAFTAQVSHETSPAEAAVSKVRLEARVVPDPPSDVASFRSFCRRFSTEAGRASQLNMVEERAAVTVVASEDKCGVAVLVKLGTDPISIFEALESVPLPIGAKRLEAGPANSEYKGSGFGAIFRVRTAKPALIRRD